MVEAATYKINQKRILLNMIASFVSGVSGSIINFILMIFIIRSIGEEGNGVFQTSTSLYAYLELAEGGISIIFKQRAYKAMGSKDYDETNAVLSSFANLYKKLRLPYIILMLAIAISYPLVSHSSDVTPIMMFAILMVVFVRKLFYISKSAPAGLAVNLYERQYVRNILNIGLTFISSAIIIFILGFKNLTIEQTILVMVSILTIKYLLYESINLKIASSLDWYKSKVEPIEVNLTNLKYQYGSTLSSLIVNSTDTITISIMLGFAKSSLYGIYSIVLIGVKGIINPIITVMETVLGKHVETNKATFSSFKLINFLTVNLAGFAFICTVLLINNFIGLSFGSLVQTKNIYAIIFAAYLMYQLAVQSMSILITATGNFKMNAKISLVEAAMNITLTIIFIAWLEDISGAIYATLITSAYKYIALAIFASNRIIEDKSLKTIIQIIRTWLPSIATTLIFMWTFETMTSQLDMNNILVFASVFVATPLLVGLVLFSTTLIFDYRTAKQFYKYVPILKRIM